MQSGRQKVMEESTVIATGKVHLSNPPAIYGTHKFYSCNYRYLCTVKKKKKLLFFTMKCIPPFSCNAFSIIQGQRE